MTKSAKPPKSVTPEMVIFSQTYDLLKWILPHCEDFPKAQRFSLTQRLESAALDFAELLYVANALHGQDRLLQLRQADACLNKMRMYLRLIHDWEWLKSGQYQHVSSMIAELGKLLGGWIRQTQNSLSNRGQVLRG